ncbi:hypothetical protein RND81_02G226100 [Saponaria officinalis]|uniref:Uncharacterized protein n=1 Tax=Saponaria officinalis TaxID=3572 RepID=A0AAW1MNA1_SAPOF
MEKIAERQPKITIHVKQFRRYPSAMDSNMETDSITQSTTDDLTTEDEMLCTLAAKVRAEREASGLHMKLNESQLKARAELTRACKASRYSDRNLLRGVDTSLLYNQFPDTQPRSS